MAVTDEGEAIEEGTERKRRAVTATQSGLWCRGWHDGVHGLTPNPEWSGEAEYCRGLADARERLDVVASYESTTLSDAWLWGSKG